MDEFDATELVPAKRAQAVLGVARNTFFESRRTGILWGFPAPRFIKKGGRIFYPQNELAEFLNNFKLIRKHSEQED